MSTLMPTAYIHYKSCPNNFIFCWRCILA